MAEESVSRLSMLKKILVPIVPDPRVDRAIELAYEFAIHYGSKITFLYIARTKDDKNIETLKEMLEKRLQSVNYDFKVRYLEEGETVASEILKELSEEHYDLVIMATRGYYGVAALVYESTSIAIALAANTSVLLLR